MWPRHGSHPSAGGPAWLLHVLEVFAAPVLDMPNHLSIYPLVHALLLASLSASTNLPLVGSLLSSSLSPKCIQGQHSKQAYRD